jgi:UDP-N-acetylglucosamine--N-acetylmuramyl-(pentapeptide) pyrophosphoryl-undecaprenol N-acetylglucosamine transferase
LRAKLDIVQQTRAEDIARVSADYERASVEAEIAPFFTDLPARIAHAHLVVARAGASTVSELALIGRPSLLVPLPQSLDGDQAANAALLARSGSAEVVRQENFSPRFLSERLAELITSPETLIARAEATKQVRVADAADRLADLVLEVARPNNGAPAPNGRPA